MHHHNCMTRILSRLKLQSGFLPTETLHLPWYAFSFAADPGQLDEAWAEQRLHRFGEDVPTVLRQHRSDMEQFICIQEARRRSPLAKDLVRRGLACGVAEDCSLIRPTDGPESDMFLWTGKD